MNLKIGETDKIAVNDTHTETVKVELSPEEAQLFIMFQKFHTDFTRMVGAGVFDVKGSQAILHFDEKGDLRRIEIYKGFKF